MDAAAMAVVAIDDGGSIAFLVLGILAAVAVVRLVLRAIIGPP